VQGETLIIAVDTLLDRQEHLVAQRLAEALE